MARRRVHLEGDLAAQLRLRFPVRGQPARFSSRGPGEDGGFKPKLVAPGSAISSTPQWQAGQPVAGTYTLPPGYAMFNGTSMASPRPPARRRC